MSNSNKEIVQAIPDGYHGLMVHLTVSDAATAIDFYTQAFQAREMYRLTESSGKIGHAELMIGNSVFMLADEYPDFGALAPPSVGGSPAKLCINVEDADQFTELAVAAGATLLRNLDTGFHGFRQSVVACPFGYHWFISTRVEVVSPETMQERFTKMLG